MADVDGLLRDSLHRHAEEAPVAGSLLVAVHARSRRLARRRRIAVAVAAVAVLAVTPVFAIRRDATSPATPAGSPSPVASKSAAGVAPAPAVTSPAPRPPVDAAVRLVPPAFAVPVFPFRPGVTPTGGLAPPVVTLEAGELTAYYAANDPVRGADVTIRVGPHAPVFGPATGPVEQAPQQVRGHAATLRTVVVAPANQLSLFWLEAPGQWVRVDTDDTLTDAEVVHFADELSAAAVQLLVPFRFDLAPAGMALDTSTPSAMAFRPPGGGVAITCTLFGSRPSGPAVSRGAAGATLTVPLDGATLVVQVPARYPVSDADLVRFGAGVHLTDRAEPR